MNKPKIKGCVNRAIEALELMKYAYPYSLPCFGWEEKATAHNSTDKALADLKEFRDALPDRPQGRDFPDGVHFLEARCEFDRQTAKLTTEAVRDE